MDDRERQYRSMLLDVRGDIDHAWYKAFNTHHPTLAKDLKESSERITVFLQEMLVNPA